VIDVNFIDISALLILGLGIYFGWRSGFVIQAFALAGFVVGIIAIVIVAPPAAAALEGLDPWLRSLIVISAIAAVVLVSQAVGSIAGGAVRRRIGNGVVGGVDTGAGAAFGLLRGLFIVWLIGGLAASLPIAGVATEARQSAIVRAIDQRLPSPAILAAQLGRLIESTGLPEAFVGAPPHADIPAGGPTQQQAEQIAAAARASTLRVEAVACDAFVSGTAFAVSRDHFVTNAHVVAGATDVWLSDDSTMDRYDASVVFIDPDKDVAVLAIDQALNVTPLHLSLDLPTRGEDAAALGYTGGGQLRLIPALISRPIDALGRDIYGNQIIAREIIEMSADVAPGDSGGPVILPDGTVGGVTFSESRTEQQVGYALSPLDVESDVANAIDKTTPVATGACVTET
jgi:S1-C subfamily serine protease